MKKPSLSSLLRQRILSDPRSWNALAIDLGVERCALRDFAQGKKSIILSTADHLAEYYGIGHVKRKRA